MPKTEDEKAVQASQEASFVLTSKAYTGAWSELEKAWIEKLLSTPAGKRHDDLRYRRQTAVDVLRGVKKQLDLVIRDGKVAKHNVDSIDKPTNRRGIF